MKGVCGKPVEKEGMGNQRLAMSSEEIQGILKDILFLGKMVGVEDCEEHGD